MIQRGNYPKEQLDAGKNRLMEAMENDYFSKTFSQQNPAIAVSIAKQYEDNIKYPPFQKPVTIFGVKLPKWISNVVRFFFPSNVVQAQPKTSIPFAPTQKSQPAILLNEDDNKKDKGATLQRLKLNRSHKSLLYIIIELNERN